MTAMIELGDVSHSFTLADRELKVLNDIDVTIDRGKFVSLIGASGCGKTTLLRTMAGLEYQTEGTVLIDGSPARIGREDIAYVFQQDALWPWRTIEKCVTFPLQMRGVPKAERTRRAHEVLELVGLDQFSKSYPHQLSGGMRQRVNISRALVGSPNVLLMDEPFGALDAQTREYLQLQLSRIVDEFQRTTMFVTHDIGEAIFLSDQVIVLSARPGSIRDVIDIPFGRGRDLSLKRTPEFQEYVDRIWNLIADDIQSAIVNEKAS